MTFIYLFDECQPRILLNHGLGKIRGGTPPIVISSNTYINGTLPIQQPRGLLIQG